jgi:hypothetical protein
MTRIATPTLADCQLHACVLMTNHVHLSLTPEHAASVPRSIVSRWAAVTSNISLTRTGEPAHSGTVGTNPPSCRPRPTCSYASATSSSTRYARAWCPDPGDHPWSNYRAVLSRPGVRPTEMVFVVGSAALFALSRSNAARLDANSCSTGPLLRAYWLKLFSRLWHRSQPMTSSVATVARVFPSSSIRFRSTGVRDSTVPL